MQLLRLMQSMLIHFRNLEKRIGLKWFLQNSHHSFYVIYLQRLQIV